MALPVHLLQSLPSGVNLVGASALPTPIHGSKPLALQSEIDALLPGGGLPRGQVIELAAATSSLASTLSLTACARAQYEGMEQRGQLPWCAFIDPSATLYAPGVAQCGVELDRLLVVQPPLEALSRVALRLVESRAFSLVVVDTFGASGGRLEVALGKWPRVIRRLSMAVANSEAIVILLTDVKAPRPLPLPVALRIELRRQGHEQLEVTVAKEKLGRVFPCKLVECQPSSATQAAGAGFTRQSWS